MGNARNKNRLKLNSQAFPRLSRFYDACHPIYSISGNTRIPGVNSLCAMVLALIEVVHSLERGMR